jgi:hypothetical protein
MERSLPKIPHQTSELYNKIAELTDSFCEQFLNEEYLQLCREMAAALCRKKSLAKGGRPESWAGGIVHALGAINFLFDKASEPYLPVGEIAKGFSMSMATVAAKSKIIRDEFELMYFDPDWSLPSKIDDNPLAWMVTINGLLCDARDLSLELQQELVDEGIIPYIPEPRQKTVSVKTAKTKKPIAKPKPVIKKDENQGELF